MIPRLQIRFSLKQQRTFLFGKKYISQNGEYLLNHARSGIVMALRTTLPNGGRVGVVAYNCHTVANAVVQGGCTPVFVDVTFDLHIDVQHLSKQPLDAIVVTNLFGIHNELDAIRQAQPNAIIIVDNAHGYGLPVEGDFCVYSINQGKFPSLGEGGILYVNNPTYQPAIDAIYQSLPAYTRKQEIKLYAKMRLKAILYHPSIYGITLRGKSQRSHKADKSTITLQRMSKGVSRMYQRALPTIPQEIAQQQRNAQFVADRLLDQKMAQRVWYGENAFMLIAQTDKPEVLKNHLMQHGVETATHFAHAIDWAQEFGYQLGTCPMAEQLTKELVMIPTYVPLAQV